MRNSTVGVLGGIAVIFAVSACGSTPMEYDEACVNQRTGEVVDPAYCDAPNHSSDLIVYYPPRTERVERGKVIVINKNYYAKPSGKVTVIKQKSNYSAGTKIPPYTPAPIPAPQTPAKPAQPAPPKYTPAPAPAKPIAPAPKPPAPKPATKK